MLAFQHRHASDKCCRIVLALFCFIPSGIMSTISCITDALNSRSKWDSTLCFVTVLATPFEWRPWKIHITLSGIGQTLVILLNTFFDTSTRVPLKSLKTKRQVQKNTERGLVPAPCLAYVNVTCPMHFILIMTVSISPILSQIPSHFLHTSSNTSFFTDSDSLKSSLHVTTIQLWVFLCDQRKANIIRYSQSEKR